MNTLRKKIWIPIAIASFGLIGCIAFVNTGVVAKQLHAWNLLPKPEPYTELFFNDYQTLPTRVTPNGTLDADMTIRNMQHEQTAYRYKIMAIPIGSDTGPVLREGACIVPHAATCVIDGQVVIPAVGPRIQIRTTIQYDGRDHDETITRTHMQSLHYWVDLELPAESRPQ